MLTDFSMLLLAHNWDSFLYQFIVGGIIFAIGIIFPIIKGDVNFSRPRDRATIFYLVTGVVIFLGFFLVWQFYAIDKG